MSDDQRWRFPAAYLYAAQLDLVDLAWEYLRRNPAYRADAARKAVARAADEDDPDGDPEPAPHWGLHFRAAARQSGRWRPRILASGAGG